VPAIVLQISPETEVFKVAIKSLLDHIKEAEVDQTADDDI
jgi:hypothetical protein